MPLRVRLTAVFTVGTVVVMAVVSGAFLLTLRAGLTANLDAALRARTSDTVAQLVSGPASTVATESDNGIYVQVLEPAGGLRDGSDALGAQSLLTPAQAATAAGTTGIALDRTTTLAATPGVSDGGPDDLRVVAVRGPTGTVVVAAASRDGIDTAVQRSGRQLLVLSVLLTAAAAVGAWSLARAALRPVESMRRQAAALEPGATGTGIDVPPGRDEVARLAETFNDLLERLQHAVDREQAFVADAGHELRTPLTVLRGELELAGRPGRSVTELRATVAVAAQETERLTRLAEDLLVLTRTGRLQQRRASVDVLELVHAAADAAGSIGAGPRVRVLDPPVGPAFVEVDPASLRRALDNVIGNALRFTPAGRGVEITVRGDADTYVVRVRDHGPGFPPEFLPRAFDRFSRADPVRSRSASGMHVHGSGLGLAIVESILSDHQGTAAVSNDPAGGAVVTLTIPRGNPICSLGRDTRS